MDYSLEIRVDAATKKLNFIIDAHYHFYKVYGMFLYNSEHLVFDEYLRYINVRGMLKEYCNEAFTPMSYAVPGINVLWYPYQNPKWYPEYKY